MQTTESEQSLSARYVELQRSPTQASIPKTSRAAIERSCRSCTPINPLVNQGWWLEFGLSENPYVYGPMPRLRTGKHFRMAEARRMGWMAWTWNDEYSEQRKAITSQSLNR